MINPALGAFGIANAAPIFKFSGDFNRQTGAGENPGTGKPLAEPSPVSPAAVAGNVPINKAPATKAAEISRFSWAFWVDMTMSNMKYRRRNRAPINRRSVGEPG